MHVGGPQFPILMTFFVGRPRRQAKGAAAPGEAWPPLDDVEIFCATTVIELVGRGYMCDSSARIDV